MNCYHLCSALKKILYRLANLIIGMVNLIKKEIKDISVFNVIIISREEEEIEINIVFAVNLINRQGNDYDKNSYNFLIIIIIILNKNIQ